MTDNFARDVHVPVRPAKVDRKTAPRQNPPFA